MDQYMDWALDRPETRAIGLFMETARNPQGMIAAFAKASRRGVPVVVLKVGRTELSARLAVSHSGALTGRDEAYQAVFDRHGVQRVRDMDELATTLMMFAQPHPTAAGGLVSIHDSGGERQLLIDLADELDVPLAAIGPATTARLEELLDPGLPPVNPLDGWGAGGPGAGDIMRDSLAVLMTDPDAALGAVVHDRAPHGALYEEYFDYLRAGHAASGKPAFLVSNRQGSGSDPAAVRITREGFPVIDGLRSFLAGVRCLLDYDYGTGPKRLAQGLPLPAADPSTFTQWRGRLASAHSTSTIQNCARFRLASEPGGWWRTRLPAAGRRRQVTAGAQTAEPSILHKTDAGVHLGLGDAVSWPPPTPTCRSAWGWGAGGAHDRT
jgi:acyl-CoA synthetase (NDP forming)